MYFVDGTTGVGRCLGSCPSAHYENSSCMKGRHFVIDNIIDIILLTQIDIFICIYVIFIKCLIKEKKKHFNYIYIQMASVFFEHATYVKSMYRQARFAVRIV